MASEYKVNTPICSASCSRICFITESKVLVPARAISLVPIKSTSLSQTQNSLIMLMANPSLYNEMPSLHTVPPGYQFSEKQPGTMIIFTINQCNEDLNIKKSNFRIFTFYHI